MSTIERQLELEQSMIDSGVSRYQKAQRDAEAAGRGHELDYAMKLMHEFILPLTETLSTWVWTTTPGRLGRARGLLRLIDANKAMFIGLRALFSSFTRDAVPAEIANTIGRMIEDEIRFTRFAQTHGDYYNEIKQDFKRRHTTDYRHMHRVLTFKANEHQVSWEPWSALERVDVGMKILDIILTETDLATKETRQVDKRTKVTEIKPTASAEKWIRDHEAFKQFLYPEKLPCIIQPDEWVANNQGGYYSPLLRQTTPMIKTTLPKLHMDKADLTSVRRSINAIQNVAWQVNKEVLDVMRTVWQQNLGIGMPPSEPLVPSLCPIDGKDKATLTTEEQRAFQDWKHEANAIYRAEKERISKMFQVSRIMRLANDYADQDQFWFVWYADFRGRLYTATAGFSPQGPDLAKGLIKFKKGLPLGDEGFYWLQVHIANRYGYDKVGYDERVDWVDSRSAELLRAADDPLSYRDTWANADNPYQFLAAIYEYRDAVRSGNPATYVSHIPIGLDGSCNGLQNFSAMLRDPVGGEATNLTPASAPSDIYAKVAGVAVRKITEKYVRANQSEPYPERDLDLFFSKKWLEYGLTRKDAKRPVMTLPYGATRQSCTQYLFQSILEKDKTHFGTGMNFKAAVWLTPLLWAAIGEVVVAAREAMDWLQKSATVMNRAESPIKWTTADGFVAWQHTRAIETVQIETQLAGRFQVRVGTYTNDIDKPAQRNGISPNFVHSNDATHMRMTVNMLLDEGITDFALIHDDYGTHAANTATMHRVIREAFVKLYGTHDPLASFKAEQETNEAIELPDLPAKGTLDINDVLNSRYFFG